MSFIHFAKRVHGYRGALPTIQFLSEIDTNIICHIPPQSYIAHSVLDVLRCVAVTSPLELRLAMVRRITEHFAADESCVSREHFESTWLAIRDMVQPAHEPRVRQAALQALVHLTVAHHEPLATSTRGLIFEVLRCHERGVDTPFVIAALNVLTHGGRDLGHLEAHIGAVLLDLFPESLKRGCLGLMLHLLRGIFETCFLSLDHESARSLLDCVAHTCRVSDDADDVRACVGALCALVHAGTLPIGALETTVEALSVALAEHVALEPVIHAALMRLREGGVASTLRTALAAQRLLERLRGAKLEQTVAGAAYTVRIMLGGATEVRGRWWAWL